MNKDVIYIDIEDDITAIIGKIKASKDKIVALVPPKRIGVLQSAVNLKLLARSAEHSHKHLVIVTNNKALIALSAVAMIPIAKNLQSKPELAEIDAVEVDESEDIIDGSQLPVGELVKTVDSTQSDKVEDMIETIDIDNDESRLPNSAIKNTDRIKVPDFSRFRKRLFIGGILAVILIGFLVWAIGFAPAAKIVITTKTSSAPVSMTLKLSSTDVTDVKKGVVQTVSKQIKKDVSVDFEATGQKDVGEKATGTMNIKNCDSNEPFIIALGTVFSTSSGKRFISSSVVNVPGFVGSASACQNNGIGAGTVDVTVVAESPGVSYNIAESNYSITGFGGRYVYASGTAMTGGTTKMATVVSAEDIQKAGQALADLSSNIVKQQLIAQFTNGESVITDSFNVDHAAAVSVPAVGEEAKGKAKLTSSTTFSITAIAKSELEVYLKDALTKQISDVNSQRIYDNGIDKVALSGYLKNDQGSSVNISAIGKIGPNIDQAAIKEQIKGKQYGDIQSLVSGIKGVSNVDINFSYFWVNTAPNDINKIDIEIKLQDV